MVCLALGELWCACAHIYGGGAAEVAGRLEKRAPLPVVQRKGLHIVERELTEVYLAVLCVAQSYAVVDHAGMVGTHRAYVDGLDAAYAAVVFHLYSGEIAECVGDAVAV